jgi:hypothetical protein
LGAQVPYAQRQRAPLSTALARPGDCSGLAFAEEDYTDSYNPIQGLLKVNPEMDPHKYPRQQIAVRSATHKYVWFDDRPGEFYDLAANPAETHNLINTDEVEQRATLDVLRQALGAWRANLELFPPRDADAALEMAPEMREQLRSLGYLA